MHHIEYFKAWDFMARCLSGANLFCQGRTFSLCLKRHYLQGSYLGDMLNGGGGVNSASVARVRCAWRKFKELSRILTRKEVSLKLKGKLYVTCVRSAMVMEVKCGPWQQSRVGDWNIQRWGWWDGCVVYHWGIECQVQSWGKEWRLSQCLIPWNGIG